MYIRISQFLRTFSQIYKCGVMISVLIRFCLHKNSTWLKLDNLYARCLLISLSFFHKSSLYINIFNTVNTQYIIADYQHNNTNMQYNCVKWYQIRLKHLDQGTHFVRRFSGLKMLRNFKCFLNASFKIIFELH